MAGGTRRKDGSPRLLQGVEAAEEEEALQGRAPREAEGRVAVSWCRRYNFKRDFTRLRVA